MMFHARTLLLPHLLIFSDVDPINRRKFKTSALNGSEYFTSLEMSRKSKSRMILKIAILGATLHQNCLMNFLTLASTLVNLKVQQILQIQQSLTPLK